MAEKLGRLLEIACDRVGRAEHLQGIPVVACKGERLFGLRAKLVPAPERGEEQGPDPRVLRTDRKPRPGLLETLQPHLLRLGAPWLGISKRIPAESRSDIGRYVNSDHPTQMARIGLFYPGSCPRPQHRVADRRIVRLIRKWLNAGVLEDGTRTRSEEGTVQGGSISPLLANIYLHYVFDLWVQQWRKRRATGDVIVVRYADDFVLGFQHRREAECFLAELRKRFARFNLTLHPDKTRLIEFGRFARVNRKRRGEGKPASFDFLGFTHSCAINRRGWHTIRRQTMRKRLQAKLREVKENLRRHLHAPVPEQGQYLRAVVRGHIRYYGVPGNGRALGALSWGSRRGRIGRLEPLGGVVGVDIAPNSGRWTQESG